ncbi:MAG: TonB family protein [Candidatus Omnitrophica bacterium]|nr:TonB family protein [Candidatus Omnitrophota bacterium]MDD5310679.1 TonB family protein [Candidatus Omnitrophota bacterium]
MNFDYAAEKDNKLLIALIFSVVIHILLLSNWPFYRNFFTDRMRSGDVEVTYVKSREQPPAKQQEAPSRRSESLPEVSPPQKLVSAELPKAAPEAKKSEAKVLKGELPAAPPKKSPGAEQSSRIVIKQPLVPKIETTTSVDASVEARGLSFIPPSYSQVVRDRIIDNIDTRKTGGEGDVYVRFVITSSGMLKEIGIIDEKSSDDGVLRAAAFQAVKDSSPFPVFPEKVRLSEVVFTCQISFARK